MKNKDYKTIHIITPETDEEYDMIQELLSESQKRLPMLEAKKNALSIFARECFRESSISIWILAARSFTSIPALLKTPRKTSLTVFAGCRTK